MAPVPPDFAMTCFVAPIGAPAATDPDTCRLVAPFETDARKWDLVEWTDMAS